MLEVTQNSIFVGDESAAIRERVVVSPCAGRFSPLPDDIFVAEGEWVEPGQTIAEIKTGSSRVQVRSPFKGWVMGMLAMADQPVHSGEALFWIWSS